MRWHHVLAVIAVCGILPAAHAETTVEIIMENATYNYCDKLVYTIKVSEITGEPAIIHIRDDAGNGSSAVPIPITEYENFVPSLAAFSEEIFPLGNYFIDVEYAGKKTTAGFTLVDSDKECLPEILKPIIGGWVGGSVSNGIMIDAMTKYVGEDQIDIPFQVTRQNIDRIIIPSWAKSIGFWWLEGRISDDEFTGAFQYMIEKDIIKMITV